MHEALKVTDDVDKAAKWEKHRKSLEDRTMQSRSAVSKKIGLTDKDLSNVLPIHPYAALILQHISIYYTSTARSMFNFIKNDEGEDVKAFQWFIDRYDFSSQNPFVTIDMLWNFFYETGSQKLADGIREVLSCYTQKMDKELMEDEKRVLKVILLLQAISERMSGNRDIFLPNNKNLTLAFEGTDLAFTAQNIAKKLLNDHVVTRTPLTGDVFSYCCKNMGPSVDPGPFIAQAKGKSTKDMSFMAGSNLRTTIEFTGALKLRYSLAYATLSDFDSEIKKANNPSATNNKLYAVATIGRDSAESGALKKKIENFFVNNPESNAIVIDSSTCVLGEGEYNEFVENYAMSLAIGNSDLDQRKTYEGYAIEVLSNWAKRIKCGDFYVYSRYATNGERVANIQDLFIYLLDIDKFHYPQCLEGAYASVLNTMYDANSLGNGATCGINEETKGTFRSGNEATKLENALKGAWKVPEYWNNSHSYIADLKKTVDEFINETFNKSDRISIASIYEMLKAEPYGFMPCNLTAFILGFILKEYTKGVYSYSDNLTTVPLDAEKLASMISEIIKRDNTPEKRYKDKFIVTLTEEERAFNKATSVAFDIPEMYCVSVTETRSRIREQMKGFSFPIWVIKYVLDDKTFKTDKDIVSKLIDNYCGIANNKNMEGEKSDNDIALTIGKLCLDNDGVVDDLKSILTKDNYDILRNKDSRTEIVPQACGLPEQWDYVLHQMGKSGTWTTVIVDNFGSENNLLHVISEYPKFDVEKRWLYYIALLICGVKNNDYLKLALNKTSKSSELIKNVFRSVLDIDWKSENYQKLYRQRKSLISELKKPLPETIDFCKILSTKGEDEIYYLTDLTQPEKEKIIKWLSNYGVKYSKDELVSILMNVYPDLAYYLSSYRYRNEFLNTYFENYKYQKITNRILPSFDKVVEEQAKGIGFLYIKRGTKISSFADGGAQEFHKRAGTENIASIVGMSIALKKSCDEMEKVNKKLLALDEAFNDVLLKSKIDFIRNGSENHVPGNINLSIRKSSGEMLLHRLDLMGMCISTGSACDSVNTEVSHVIKAIGVPSEYSEGTIRISFGRDNTEEDAVTIARALVKVLNE